MERPLLEQAREAARPLEGAHVLHVNATAYGGGVAELLASEVALMVDLGVVAEWRVICPDDRLFAVTKRIHNAMQGDHVELSAADWEIYRRHNEHCAAMLANEWDVVVVHDPQPAALVSADPAPTARWIWRCHIDTSTPDQQTWDALRPHVLQHDRFVFTLDAFRPADLPAERTRLIAPAIDPLSAKNRPLPGETARDLVRGAGVDPDRPQSVHASPESSPCMNSSARASRRRRSAAPAASLAASR